MSQVIAKEELLNWLRGLLPERSLVAPTRVDELVLYRQVSSVDDIALDFPNSDVSPKEWLFPATDTLFIVDRSDGNLELQPTVIQKDTVLFAIRPCDARGLALLDPPYLTDPADESYRQRRERLYLVGLACVEATPQCFCTSVGSGPHDPSALDVMLTPTDGEYIVQTVTEKGKALLQGASLRELEVAPPPAPEVAEVPVEGIVEAMPQAFDDPYWGRVADRCIHCNICSYLCPTCYCFDVRDYVSKSKIERIRTWESCQSAGFTRIAGGYDPRANKGARLRQRFYHKLLYFPRQFNGSISCVGCGRCVSQCPVNIDIREIISDVQEMAKSGARA